MKKIKGFQLENNSVTKNKIKLIGNNSLVSSDIKLNTSSNKTIENRFIEINNDLNGLNNNVNNLSQQVAQVISSYGANVIELPITETLSAFTPVGFDSNGNIKKFSTTNKLTNPSISTVKTLTFSDSSEYFSLHKISTNIGERIFIGYQTSNLYGRIYLYSTDENFEQKAYKVYNFGSTYHLFCACNQHIAKWTSGQLQPIFISNDIITEGSSISASYYPHQCGDNVLTNIHPSSYHIKYSRSGNSYSTENITNLLTNKRWFMPYSFIEYTSSQFTIRHFTNYWPCKLKIEYIYNIPSEINITNTYYTYTGHFIDLSNNRIFWDDNDGQGLKIINSPVSNIRQICQLYNNWYVIFGSSTYKIVPSINTTLNYNNYPTYNHSYIFTDCYTNYLNYFTPGQITSSYSLFSVFNLSTKNLTVFKINYTFLPSNFIGILLENANQGEIKKIAAPKSIITIPNANFIPGRYYIFNASTNTYEQTSDKNNAIFKALTNNKVYILDNLG